MFLKFGNSFGIAIKKYCQEVKEKEGNIISFGILTDSDMSSFTFYYNTNRWLTKKIEDTVKFNEEFPDETFPIDIDRWFLNEWKSENDSYLVTDDYKQLISQMEMLYLKYREIDFIKYKDEMFNFLCTVLASLKEEGYFKDFGNDFILLVQESDNFDKKKHSEGLKKILSEEQLNNYIKCNEIQNKE